MPNKHNLAGHLVNLGTFHTMKLHKARRSYHEDSVVPVPMPNTIFVFGSNLAGIHGAGAALVARKLFSAAMGTSTGRNGRAYAIPTKDENMYPLPLDTVGLHVRRFIDYTAAHPDLQFFVTRVGCGLAGGKDSDIAPLFADALNCSFPLPWKTYLGNK